VVAPARAVGVELGGGHALGDEVPAGGGVELDAAGRRDVVGGDALTEEGQHARALHVRHRRRRLAPHALEVRGMAHVRGPGVPREQVAAWHGQRAPGVVAGIDVGVPLAEHLGAHRPADDLFDLRSARPQLAQEDRAAVPVVAERLVLEVHVDAAGERERDHQRW
jgi:hypothetical protein